MKKLGFIVTLLIGFSITIHAQTVNIVANAGAGKFQLPGGGDVANGSSYEVGRFNSAGYTGQNDYASISGLFTFFGPSITSTGGEFFASGQSLSGGSNPEPLYALVYDSTNDAIGIFSSSSNLWNYPSGTNFATMSNGVSEGVDEFITGNTTLSLTAIPEPSTYALIFGGLAIAGVIWKRRKIES